MNRNSGLIGVIILLALLLGAFIYYQSRFVPKYKWNQKYSMRYDQPYGLKNFYAATEKITGGVKIIYRDELSDSLNSTNSNLILIDEDVYLDSAEAQQILSFAEDGNCVLIASEYAPLSLLRMFIPVGDSISIYDTLRTDRVRVNFDSDRFANSKPMNFHYRVLKDTLNYIWHGYRNSYFKEHLEPNGFISLASVNDIGVCVFMLETGKGRIIVHSNPLLFTNYNFARSDGYRHANLILSLLNKGPVLWFSENNQSFKRPYNNNNPIRFLFSHPHLRWAWYLFLFTVVLYLAFHSKREQRVIPLSPANTNSSIAFTKAIGTLYFQNKGHKYIAEEMRQAFLSGVRTRYGLLTDLPEMVLIEQLSQRSGIAKNVLFNLFKQFKTITTEPDTAGDSVIDLYNAIELYNQKRK